MALLDLDQADVAQPLLQRAEGLLRACAAPGLLAQVLAIQAELEITLGDLDKAAILLEQAWSANPQVDADSEAELTRVQKALHQAVVQATDSE